MDPNNPIRRGTHLHCAQLSIVARTAVLAARQQRLSLASAYLDMLQQTTNSAARERFYASAARLVESLEQRDQPFARFYSLGDLARFRILELELEKVCGRLTQATLMVRDGPATRRDSVRSCISAVG